MNFGFSTFKVVSHVAVVYRYIDTKNYSSLSYIPPSVPSDFSSNSLHCEGRKGYYLGARDLLTTAALDTTYDSIYDHQPP